MVDEWADRPTFFFPPRVRRDSKQWKKKEKKGKSGAASVSGYLKKINYPSVGARMSREPEVGSRP